MNTHADRNGTSYQQIKHDYHSAQTVVIVITVWLFVFACIAATWPVWCLWTYLACTVAFVPIQLVRINRQPRA